MPKVQTSRKKFEQKVRAYKNWIYDNRNRPMREIIKELNVKLIGHYRYYGVTWNFRKITTFLHRVQQFLFKAMNRRGCRRAYTWNGFVEMLKYYPLAKPKTYYCLYWSECYYEEPYAGKPHVRICEGLRLRGLSLLDCRIQKFNMKCEIERMEIIYTFYFFAFLRKKWLKNYWHFVTEQTGLLSFIRTK